MQSNTQKNNHTNMKTLSPKVLPTLRVLLHNCNFDDTKSLHLLSPNGKHKLAMRKIVERKNEKFDFYQVTDGEFLLINIAVLKENTDSIVPFRYLFDDNKKEEWITMVDFAPDGTMTFREQSDKKLQETFAHWMNLWFETINQNHRIA